jgi:NMD protein affecting ribosome stability and mRNA decay
VIEWADEDGPVFHCPGCGAALMGATSDELCMKCLVKSKYDSQN